jgi:hypothetical protein
MVVDSDSSAFSPQTSSFFPSIIEEALTSLTSLFLLEEANLFFEEDAGRLLPATNCAEEKPRLDKLVVDAAAMVSF